MPAMVRRIGILLVIGLLAACGSRSTESAQPASPSSSGAAPASTASPLHSHAATASASPTPVTHSRGGHARSMTGGAHQKTSTVGGSSHTQHPQAQSIAPRQAGTYHYDTSGQTTYGGGFSQQPPSDTTLTVDPPNGPVQRSVRDMRDSQGNGSVSETWLQFRSDGVYLDRVKTTTQFGPYSNVLDLSPKQPVLVAKPGAGPGAHTEFAMTGSNTTVHVTIDVIRKDRLTIGGRGVDTYLVRTHSTFSGDVQGESTADTWFTPDRLLPVKEHVVTDAQTSAGSSHSEYRAQLKQLSPS